MKNRQKIYTLTIFLVFLIAMPSCRFFAPETEEPETELPAEPVTIEEVGVDPSEEDEPEELPTAESEPTLAPTPTLTPTPQLEAAILTNAAGLEDPAPRLIGQSPARTSLLGLDEPIELYFDQPMAAGVTGDAFSLIDENNLIVPGRVEWPQPRIMRFTPETVLTTGSQYSVILAETAAAANGKTLAQAVSLDLFTIGNLEITSVSPADGLADLEPDSAITVIFNRPVVPLVNAEEQDTLPSPITISPAVEGSGEWVNTSVYIWRPTTGFPGRTTYDVTVSAGTVNEMSVSGAQLAEDLSWQFSVMAPTLRSIGLLGKYSPNNEVFSDVELDDQRIAVYFNQPMNESVTESAVSLVGTNGGAEPLQFGWNELSTTLIVTPTRQLAISSQYLFSVSDSALSVNGGALLEGRTVEINTVDFPSIAFQKTAQTADPGQYRSNFGIFFNTPMDPDTLPGKVIFDPPISGNPEGTYNSWENAIWFWSLLPATDYTVTLQPGMADPYGNRIDEPLSFAFRTADRNPSARLEMHNRVSMYRYNGSSSAWVSHLNSTDIQLNVYEFSNFRTFFSLIDSGLADNYDPSADIFLQTETVAGDPGSNQTRYAQFELRDPNGNMHPPGFYFVSLQAGGVFNGENL
ncbi:MAG: Ig-like domain-containing protein, partial [Chloroflexota bacterium]